MTRLLILGGTGEAAALAKAAGKRFGARVEVITSLAGRTRQPRAVPGTVRTGGFGGVRGLEQYLRDARVDLVVDATHPYATRISANARVACAEAIVPRAMLLRLPWTREPADRWIAVRDVAEAARRLPDVGRRAFVAIGSGELSAFANVEGVYLLMRVAEAPQGPPLSGADWIVGRGPFRDADELRLLRDRRIDVVVSRNSGGTATAGKIAAARRLAIPVIMIDRPMPEPGPCTLTIEETIEWIAGQLA